MHDKPVVVAVGIHRHYTSLPAGAEGLLGPPIEVTERVKSHQHDSHLQKGLAVGFLSVVPGVPTIARTSRRDSFFPRSAKPNTRRQRIPRSVTCRQKHEHFELGRQSPTHLLPLGRDPTTPCWIASPAELLRGRPVIGRRRVVVALRSRWLRKSTATHHHI